MLAHRADWDGSTIVALHSFASDRIEARVAVEAGVEEAVDLLGSADAVPDGDGVLAVPLDPYGYRWFRLRRDRQRLPP